MTSSFSNSQVANDAVMPGLVGQPNATGQAVVNPSRLVSVMRLLQFSDSYFPVGSFAFSNGLESAVQTGVVSNKADLQEFVDLALQQAASMDGVALLHAYRAWQEGNYQKVVQADQALWARRVGEEQQLMLARMGKKLAELSLKLSDFVGTKQWLADINAGKTPGCYPIAQALTLAELNAGEEEAFAVHQYGVASMILSAALRLMRIDHLDTQSILFDTQERVYNDYLIARDRTLNDMSVFAPVFDVLVAHHTKTRVRLFMN